MSMSEIFKYVVNNPARPINQAKSNIAQQRQQFSQLEGLTQPFIDAATKTALPQLSNMAFGGNIDYQPSVLFGRQLEQGKENIFQQQAARGGLKSSNTFSRLSDLVSGLAANDLGRFEQGQQGLLNQGVLALNQLDNAQQGAQGNVQTLLSMLQDQSRMMANRSAQDSIARTENVANTIGSFGDLLSIF